MKTHRKIDPRRWSHTATYEGRGDFPLDMLRYDACWPSTQDDVSIIDAVREVRRVSVTTYGVTAADPFTDARWASFGWARVDE